MDLNALTALLSDPPPPPKPPKPAPKPATTAFQRNLAEQRAAARNAPDPQPVRPSAGSSTRTPRQAAKAQPQRQAAEREPRQANAPERQQANAEPVFVAGGYGGAAGGGSGSGGGQGNLAGAASGMPVQAGEGDDLDCAMLLDLLPGDGDSGIFELLLPGGDRLAVVADIAQRQASFLLTPSSDRLRQMLNKRKMELENGLAQRMDRHVRLTVL